MGWISRAAIAAIAAALQGCASIVGGSMQPISVQSTHNGEPVSGASCSLSNDKGTWFVSTPGAATVQRSFDRMQLRCTKPPLPPGEVSARSLVRPLALGNIVFGGVVGVVVDHATGSSYYYPELVTVEMGRSIQVSATPVGGSPPAPAEAAGQTSQSSASMPASPAPAVPAEAPAPKPAPAQPSSSAQPARAVGQESYQVARMAEVKACNPDADPVLVSKTGSTMETYTVACRSGGTIKVVCEWGACRVTK